MFKKKKTIEPVKPVATTADVMKAAMTRVQTDIQAYNTQKDGALSVFRATASKLEAINKGLEASVQDLDEMIKFASEQKCTAEKHIADNTKVRDKIINIIGG